MSGKTRLFQRWLKTPAWRALLLWALPAAFLAYFFYQPLLALISLVLTGRFAVVSPAWGVDLSALNLNRIWQPLTFTVGQAALSTLLTLIIGLPGAWLFTRFTFPGKEIITKLSVGNRSGPNIIIYCFFQFIISIISNNDIIYKPAVSHCTSVIQGGSSRIENDEFGVEHIDYIEPCEGRVY